ncbi:adenylate/guanylate cyclase domain-containing protein, partial [Mycobacterium sp.]|uniref:ATP-binding protein n=1 Tax=Mycobacterium sp. TaxID=1785 RepID=UPI003C7417F4
MSGCATCGTQPREGDKFCHECGAPVTVASKPAEYKQVTVLFADVVRSMDIAAAVGAERLREIMAELVTHSSAIVQRYSGTVDKFTGDGIMAVFGAPIALEDHAFRACLTALEIQAETQRLAVEVEHCDGITLQLRIGLNSGQVIAGEIGAGPLGYTAIGEQVGMAQRMESVAPPGGVMLSESAARLVGNTALLGDPEMVHIKGSEQPVSARRLLGIGGQQARRRGESPLVGRTWELNTITGILDEAINGAGCVVGVVGPAGIGKSRLVRESAAIAASRGVPVFGSYCESHASDIPFHVVARLLRGVMGVEELDDATARALVRERLPDVDSQDLLLLDDLLGIRDAAVAVPDIAPDARRRRVTALINGAALAQSMPGVYIVEDAHWIDDASESMLTDFLTVIPQTRSLVLITYRPEYHGALSRVSGAPTVALRPLSDTHTSALTAELLGEDSSVAAVAATVAERASGNPFFVEEMVRDLAERGVLHGQPGGYSLRGDLTNVDVPATLQATIGARIDRLDPSAKETLTAAAVIGTRFDIDLLRSMVENADVAPLIEAELVDQVRFTPHAQYAFRHPLIRTVAYESQLKSDRQRLHRRLAAMIEQNDPGSAEENAALIAEHYEAAGDLHAAFSSHMRAGTWLANRNIAAARTSWRRARQVADRLPDDEPDRISMRIAPRTILCATAFRTGSGADTGFDELRDLCVATGDQRSLALGMSGLMIAENMNAHHRKASRLASEIVEPAESVGDPILTIALLSAAVIAKLETAEVAEVLRMSQRVIELTDGDPTKGNLMGGSPLAFCLTTRGVARMFFGVPGWKEDLRQAVAMAGAFEPMSFAGVIWHAYIPAIVYGGLLPDETAVRDTAEALAIAEQSGDDLALDIARTARGVIQMHHGGPDCRGGLEFLVKIRERVLSGRFSLIALPIVNIHIAREKLRSGYVDDAIELSRGVFDGLFDSGPSIWG